MEWENLFKKALICLDTLPFKTAWSFGGGTALMLEYQHRYSKDIDIFIKDPQIIPYLTPRLNDEVGMLLNGRYNEQSNFLKLYFNAGEIDFIVSPSLTNNPYIEKQICNRTVLFETPEEIIAKKIFYRSNEFTARDIFDTAHILSHSNNIEKINCFLINKKDTIINRININNVYFKETLKKIDVLPNGVKTLDNAIEIILQHINHLNKKIKANKPQGVPI